MRARTLAAPAALIVSASCAAVRPPTPPPAAANTDAVAAREWLSKQPEGCALGQSGPTLKPTDAFREARRRARAALVTAVETIRQKSAAAVTHSDGKDGHHEVILEQAEGWVRRSTIVALWYDERGTGPSGAVGTAYAAACLGEAAPTATRAWMQDMEARRGAPAWVYGGASPSGELCAVGIAGPTMDPKDAPANAEASARDELAEALAAHVRLAVGIFDDETLSGSVTEVADGERERARQARIASKWTDERGVGPIPFPGTAYARACSSL